MSTQGRLELIHRNNDIDQESDMASIRCGECGGTHASVQEVNNCYADDQYDEGAERGLAEAERINSQSFCGELRVPTYEDYLERELEAWTEV